MFGSAHCHTRSCEDVPQAVSGPEAVRKLGGRRNGSQHGIHQRPHRLRAGSAVAVHPNHRRGFVGADWRRRSAQVRSTEMRTRLAQRLLRLARFWWTATQIKQLLLRTLRNEASASRIEGPVGGAEVNQENGDRTTHPDVRYGSVPDVNGYETMSRLVPKSDMCHIGSCCLSSKMVQRSNDLLITIWFRKKSTTLRHVIVAKMKVS